MRNFPREGGLFQKFKVSHCGWVAGLMVVVSEDLLGRGSSPLALVPGVVLASGEERTGTHSLEDGENGTANCGLFF